MTQDRIEKSIEQGIPVLVIHTYFDADVGKTVSTMVEEAITQGCFSLVIDLSACAIINSSGVATLLDLACRIVQDFRGSLFLVGLDTLKRSVLDIGGVLMFAEEKPTRAEAVTAAADSHFSRS